MNAKWIGTRAMLALVLAVAIVAPGCLKLDQKTEVYPDGSGRIEISVGLSPMMDMLKNFAPPGEEAPQIPDPGEQFREQAKAMKGVHWEEPTTETKDGWTITKMVGYFEDIRAVKGDDGASFDFEKTAGGGYRLTVTEASVSPMPGEMPMPEGELPPEVDPEMLENPMVQGLLKQLLGDLRISRQYILPGAITKHPKHEMVKKVDGNARAAQILITGEDIDIQNLGAFQEKMEGFAGKPTVWESGAADDAAIAEAWKANGAKLAALSGSTPTPAPVKPAPGTGKTKPTPAPAPAAGKKRKGRLY